MSDKPLVSIIVPAYNAESFIAECLESIIGQSYKNIEIIVIDDGSKDRTAEIINNYSKHVRYFYQNPTGTPAIPRNVGISNSRGEYLCFFDSDDIMSPDYILKQVDFLGRHPTVGMVFCDYRNFNETGPYDHSQFETCPQLSRLIGSNAEIVLSNACRILARENFGIMGTLMIRRAMLEYERTFNTDLKACIDFFFYYKLARYTQVGVINYIGQMRRFHQNNITDDKYKMLEMRIRSRTLLAETEEDPQAKSFLKDYLASCWSSRARYNAGYGKYSQAFKDELQALAKNLTILQLLIFIKSTMRTSLFAIGVLKLK